MKEAYHPFNYFLFIILIFYLFSSTYISGQNVYAKYKVGKDIFTFYDNGAVTSDLLVGQGSWNDDGNTITIEMFSSRYQNDWYFMSYSSGIGEMEAIEIFNPNDMSINATMTLIGKPRQKSEQNNIIKESKAEQYIKEGNALYNEGKYQEAIESYSRGLDETFFTLQ